MKGKELFALSVLTLALNQAVYATDDSAVADQNNSTSTQANPPKTSSEKELPTVEVRDSSLDKSYVEPVSSVATKTDAPVIDTPVSVSTVTRALMDDRQMQNLQEAAQSTSGVVNNRDPWGPGFQDTFNIRGFDDGSSGYFYDGLRMDALTAEVENLESLDVSKGPATALYGNEGSEGGAVNLSVKKPKADAHYFLKGMLGSFNYAKEVADLTGPLNESKTLRYRLVGVNNTEGSYVDLGSGRRKFGAASLEWVPSEATHVLLRREYDSIHFVPSEGAPYYSPTGIVNMPTNVNDIAPADYNTVLSNTRLDWSHTFDNNWKISQRNQYDKNSWDYKVVAQFPSVPMNSVARYAYIGYQDLKNEAHNLDVTGTVKVLGIANSVLIGTDYRHYYVNPFTGYAANAGTLPNFDFTNPNYYAGINWNTIIANSTPFVSLTDKRVNGLYFNDMANLTDKWRLMLGGRFDYVRSRSVYDWTGSLANAQAAMAASDGSDHAFSPRVGLLYKIRTDWSVYSSYATGFSTNNGFAFDGSKMAPVHTKSYEVGSKTEFFDGKASSTVALYQIIKSNMLVPDINHTGFSINSGRVKSQGVDLDLTGKLTDHWSTTSVLGYNSMSTMDANIFGPAGTHIPGIRNWRGSVWTKYQLNATEEQGLSLGGGIFFASKTNIWDWGSGANFPYNSPGWTRVDLSTSYGWKSGKESWTARLAVKNLLNRTYVDAYYYATPRNVLGTVEMEF